MICISQQRIAAFFVTAAIWFAAPNMNSGRGEAPPDLAKWGLYCFCITARHTPQAVIQVDNNGRILWNTRNGATLEELRAIDASTTGSQLLLLRTFGLLAENGPRFTTAFPVLGPDIIVPLRIRLRGLAERFAPKVVPEARTIGSLLDHSGLSGHTYAVVFGYALDGLLWDELRNRETLPATALDLDHPIWRGAFWAIYPQRFGVPGTNEAVLKDSAIVAVWTDRNVTALNKQLASAKASSAVIGPTTATTSVGPLPVVRDKVDDPIHDAAQRIADATTRALLDTPEGAALLDSIPHASRAQAVVILAHELIWDVTESLVKAGSIVRPAALDADRPTAAQLTQLMFVRVSR